MDRWVFFLPALKAGLLFSMTAKSLLLIHTAFEQFKFECVFRGKHLFYVSTT